MRWKSMIVTCPICGRVLEVSTESGEPDTANLICCGREMERMPVQSADAAREKHVPIAAPKSGGGTEIRVGAVPHPMTETHWIEWIELIRGDRVVRQYLRPGDQPMAEFCEEGQSGDILREYCSLHGVWESRIQ